MASKTQSTIKEVKASIGDLRISPRKVRIVAELIKRKSVNAAKEQLTFLSKYASRPLLKLIESAVANASNNFKLDPNKLRIKDIRVDQGVAMKRYKARAQGRVSPVRHRTSRVNLVLVEDLSIKVDAATAREQAVKAKAKNEPHEHEEHEHHTKEKTEAVAKQPRGDRNEPAGKKKAVDLKKRLFNRKTNA